MYILNITYVITENKVVLWKNWLKETTASNQLTINPPAFRIYKINHIAEEGQTSFSVQFDFDNFSHLTLFEKELEIAHAQSLSSLLGAHCLFFNTTLTKEEL